MPAQKAKNNRTIAIEDSEISTLKSCLTTTETLNRVGSFQDLLINADLFDVLETIPDGIADLIIIDPPYNLTKNFNGMAFNARSDQDYEAYFLILKDHYHF